MSCARRLAPLVAVLALVSGCGSSGRPGRVSTVVQTGFYRDGSQAASPSLPVVVGDFGTQPRVAAGVGAAPSQPSMSYLTDGTGAPVRTGSRPRIRYTRSDWRTGAVSHDSWAAGITSETLPITAYTAGIAGYLNLVSIGSRVELVNPIDQGQADVYVIDVVGQGN